MKIANKIFENVLKLKYFAKILTNKNYFYEEIRSRLNMEDACTNSVQNLWCVFCLKHKNYSIVLSVICTECFRAGLVGRNKARQKLA